MEIQEEAEGSCQVAEPLQEEVDAPRPKSQVPRMEEDQQQILAGPMQMLVQLRLLGEWKGYSWQQKTPEAEENPKEEVQCGSQGLEQRLKTWRTREGCQWAWHWLP